MVQDGQVCVMGVQGWSKKAKDRKVKVVLVRSGMVKDCQGCSNMFKDVQGCSRMAKDGQGWSRMVNYGPG